MCSALEMSTWNLGEFKYAGIILSTRAHGGSLIPWFPWSRGLFVAHTPPRGDTNGRWTGGSSAAVEVQESHHVMHRAFIGCTVSQWQVGMAAPPRARAFAFRFQHAPPGAMVLGARRSSAGWAR